MIKKICFGSLLSITLLSSLVQAGDHNRPATYNGMSIDGMGILAGEHTDAGDDSDDELFDQCCPSFPSVANIMENIFAIHAAVQACDITFENKKNQ